MTSTARSALRHAREEADTLLTKDRVELETLLADVDRMRVEKADEMQPKNTALNDLIAYVRRWSEPHRSRRSLCTQPYRRWGTCATPTTEFSISTSKGDLLMTWLLLLMDAWKRLPRSNRAYSQVIGTVLPNEHPR